MSLKFEWDFDFESGEDLQSFFHLDHLFNTSAGDIEAEFYSGINPTLPNDDIWKKLDMAVEFDQNENLDDLFEDVASVIWMSPLHTQAMTKHAREMRIHDCMWAGYCTSEKHDKSNEEIQKCVNSLPIKKPPAKPKEPQIVTVSAPEKKPAAVEGNKICIKKNTVAAPTHGRSLLLPTRVISAPAKGPPAVAAFAPAKESPAVAAPVPAKGPPAVAAPAVAVLAPTKKCPAVAAFAPAKEPPVVAAPASPRSNRIGALDSEGESLRPETPQSLSDNEDLVFDLPEMKMVVDFAVKTFGHDFVSKIVNNVESDVSNSNEDFDWLETNFPNRKHESFAAAKVAAAAKPNRTNAKQEDRVARPYITYSFFSDHCYHLRKNARMDNLGVQTPFDSENEIDVKTVYEESKKPSSRSSSSIGSVFSTNSSYSDRQQLQVTTASAIIKKDAKRKSARTSLAPLRYGFDDNTIKFKTLLFKRKTNVSSETRQTGKNGGGGRNKKQNAQLDDYNEHVNKSMKRKKYQYQRHFKTAKSKKPKNRRNYVRNVGGLSSKSKVNSSKRRTIHNSMERQRTIDLRNAFEELRKLVPFTAGNEKAPKVMILNYGAEFCKSLTLEESELTKKKAELMRQQEMLRAKVSQLRRSLAARR